VALRCSFLCLPLLVLPVATDTPQIVLLGGARLVLAHREMAVVQMGTPGGPRKELVVVGLMPVVLMPVVLVVVALMVAALRMAVVPADGFPVMIGRAG
jgi:hypothetical protein